MNLNPLSSSFNKNPADSAMPYLEQIPGTISPYYNNYVNSGKESLSELMRQFSSLVSNPAAKYSQLAESYTPSPGYQFQYNQGMNAANSAAAAGGFLGSGQHQMNSASMASNLANQDFNTYLSQILGMYQQGLQGYQGVNQMGYGASNELANSLANNLLNQANLSFAGTQQQNKANSDLFGSLLGLGSSLVAPFLP